MSAGILDVCCIVLAAGSSRRFGSDKRLARLPDGRSLLDATLAAIPPVFVQRLLVLRPGDEALAVPHANDWQCLFAAAAASGMGHSLAAGLAACTAGIGALVVLADMPAVRPDTCNALALMLRPDGITVPRYLGRRGNPVGIGRNYFGDLAEASGDQGARRLLQDSPAAVRWFDCDDPGILVDIDEPAALGGNMGAEGNTG